jgi:hypothetical protein
MTSTIENTSTNSVCPRCRSTKTTVLTRSPVKGAWLVHGCQVCFYAWRNTEPEENRNPDKYPKAFRLNPDEVDDFIVVPTIPPLRESAD